jgi:NitT/TauT family transport system substrate-binding protein
MPIMQSRRRFLTTLSIAGAAGLIGAPHVRAAEDRLETTSIRLPKANDMCMAPQYVADELLRAEGFRDIQYVQMPIGEIAHAVGSGKVDLSLNYVSQYLVRIDGGEPITLVAGVMVGCIEVFAQEGIHGIADLRGKRIGVPRLGSPNPHGLVSAMLAHVGLDPARDVEWVPDPRWDELFIEGKVDAIEALPPRSQELRARHIGHVIVNNAVDRPWSDYFCCLLGGNREFVHNNPVATKRVLRAMLKATDFCSSEPARAAQSLVDGGFTPRYDSALQAIRENGFDKWREYDAEDTVRFYALRLHEVGFIKSSPQKIIAENTDWRFLNELKRELKA